MTYIVVIEKQQVSKINAHLFNATIKMIVNDGQSDVFTTEVSERYSKSEPDLVGIETRLIDQLNEKFDKFAAENTLFTASKFNTMVDNIQVAVNTHINQ